MKRWLKDHEEGLVQLENRYTVSVELIVVAETMDEAETEVTELIQEGILAIAGEDETRQVKVLQYNIVDVEPAEVF